MKSKENTTMNTSMRSLFGLIICLLFGVFNAKAQAEDPQQGLRADWLRGTWGLNWKPVDLYNGGHEGLSIKPFLNQISHLKTIDYIQIHLGESSIKSSVHMGPHPLLESFWEGDTDGNGNPINLVVPRASFGEDPFLEAVKDIRAAGMKVMVYINSSNMLNRVGTDNPDYIPNITERWKAWCDTNIEAQAFIASEPYHTGVWNAASGTYVDATSSYPNRKYMFCYAEFVLKIYAERYGNLIDAWCFDSGSYMALNGDSQTNGVYEDQMIFNAFKAACHAGNPNAALSFQNSPERDTEELNPFSEAVHADDFMFGHPYNGGKDGGSHTIGDPSLYSRNYAHIEKIKETNGNVHSGIDAQTWTWDDKVVGHYDPPMSTTSWNGGNTPALTDDEFNLWNLEAVQYGGAISWGLPLQGKSSGDNNRYIANEWALDQLNGMDAHLMELESSGAPNWARQYTILPPAYKGFLYSHKLTEGFDFWDPEGDAITSLIALGSFPSWLTITETTPGVWTLSGTPAETTDTDYEFNLQANDASGGTNRKVTLNVLSEFASTEVQVKATASTNYGISTKAVMYSDVQTAPDGLATFRVSVDITPPSDKAVISGISGGEATVNSWGLGDGTNNNSDDIFTGSDNEWVESINHIQFIDFNANGGSLSLDNFIGFFKSMTIVNAQSTNDFISLKVNTTVFDIGATENKTDTIDLELETSINNITDFAIGTGNTSETNKWAVEGINIVIQISDNSLSNPNINQEEIETFKLFPNPANNQISFNINPVETQIFDVTGKLLKFDNTRKNTMDISTLNSGIYIVKVQNEKGYIFFKKLLKE
jgi:hypothetical protein